MKKKRIDNKKNGSSSNAVAHGSDGVNGPSNDKHHSRSTPCSNLSAAIAQEIFPTVAQPTVNANATGRKNHGAADNGGKKCNAVGPNSKEGKSATHENGSSNKNEQPLLGFMIQSYLVQERIKARGSIGNSNGSSSKKKKNKKKRKKKAAATLAQVEANVGGELFGDNQCQAAGAATLTFKEPSPSLDTDENGIRNIESSNGSAVKKTLKLSSCLPSFESNPLPSPDNGIKDEKVPLGLDRLLDSLIDSKDVSFTNGSESIKRSDRSIEAFSAFLARKFESHLEMLQQTQQKKEKPSIKSSSSSPGSAANEVVCSGIQFKDILPTISINDAHDLSHAANCRTCRTSATCHLRSLIREKPLSIVGADAGIEIEYQPPVKNPLIILNEDSAKLQSPSGENGGSSHEKKSVLWDGCGYSLSIPKSSRFSDGVENAFDYMSMDDLDLEAGKQPKIEKEESAPTPSALHLELRPISQASEKVRFLQIAPVSEEINGGVVSVRKYPMNTQDIINLVKCILLPCGLGEEGKCNTPDLGGLSKKELSVITKRSFDALGKIQSELLTAKVAMVDIKDEMARAEDCNNRTVFDTKTSKILNDCDEKCVQLFKQLGDFILRLFKSVCYVGWSGEFGLSLLELFLHLWEHYAEGFIHLVDPVMEYRGKVLAAVDRQGKVPQAYMCKVTRDSLQELITKKISALDKVLEECSHLTKGRSDAPSPMLRLCVVEAYRRHFEPQTTADNVFPDRSGEELFIQLIDAQIDLAQMTITGPSPEVAMEKAQGNRAKMTTLSKQVRRVIIAMEDFAPQTKVDFLITAYINFESSWYDFEKDQRELERTAPQTSSSGEIAYEVKEMSLLLQRSGVLISQWLILLCARQCNESLMKSLTLPSVLKIWLNNISGAEMPKPMPGDECIKPQCKGGGGERRVSSIWAGLIYRWLEARCSEWHAELTRDELLQSMDMEKPVVVVREGGIKSGKKKKSKRKSKGNKDKGALLTKVTEESMSRQLEESKHVEKPPQNELDNAKENCTQAQESASSATDKKPVVGECSTDTTPGGKKYQHLKISQDEEKNGPIEVGAYNEIQTLEAEHIKLSESLSAIEEIEAEVSSVLEGGGKQKKSESTSAGDNRRLTNEDKNGSQNVGKETSSTEKSHICENSAVGVAQAEEEDAEIVVDAQDESQKWNYDGSDADVVPIEDPEKESALSEAHESSCEQLDGLEGNMNFKYQPNVGIIEGKQVLTAEVYLVKRYIAIAEMKEMNFTPSTKTVPVVWM